MNDHIPGVYDETRQADHCHLWQSISHLTGYSVWLYSHSYMMISAARLAPHYTHNFEVHVCLNSLCIESTEKRWMLSLIRKMRKVIGVVSHNPLGWRILAHSLDLPSLAFVGRHCNSNREV